MTFEPLFEQLKWRRMWYKGTNAHHCSRRHDLAKQFLACQIKTKKHPEFPKLQALNEALATLGLASLLWVLQAPLYCSSSRATVFIQAAVRLTSQRFQI